MNIIQYAIDNFLKAVRREEYINYATGNPYAEVDANHFQDVSLLVQKLWLKKFNTSCPEALIIAGLYHDFDRVFPKDYSYDENICTSKRAIDTKSVIDKAYSENEIKLILHPKNCAAIFRDYNPLISDYLKEDISYLIERHEIGGEKVINDKLVEKTDKHTQKYNLNEAAEVLCEADGLSFFTVIIYSYVKGRTNERIIEKISLSYNKLSNEGKEIVKELDYKNIKIEEPIINISALINSVIK